jgi:hypothetical protein
MKPRSEPWKEWNMFTRALPATFSALALVLTPLQAMAEEWGPDGRDTAIAACIDLNGYKPATLVEAVEDGLGDWIVWVEDTDGDLWLCNANGEGSVYANVYLEGDLLKGEGADFVSYEDDSGQHPGPAGRAEELCSAVGALVDELEIVATVDDALGDYLVWLQNADGAYWMCNASSEAELYTFEPVQYPLGDEEATEEDICCETDKERQV